MRDEGFWFFFINIFRDVGILLLVIRGIGLGCGFGRRGFLALLVFFFLEVGRYFFLGFRFFVWSECSVVYGEGTFRCCFYSFIFFELIVY